MWDHFTTRACAHAALSLWLQEKEEKSELHEKRLRILGEEMNTEELKEVLQVSGWLAL